MTSLLLPSPGDPIILSSWIKTCKKIEHLFDEIIIFVNYINSSLTLEPETKIKLDEYYRSFENDKIKIVIEPYINQHGLVLSKLIELSSNDYVVFFEDDDYVVDVDYLEKNIELVTSGAKDVVGLDRGSCNEGVLKNFSQRHPNRGLPGFWPTYFIFKKSLYYKTDKVLTAKSYNEEDGYEAGSSSDTMVWFSIQLHDLLDYERIYYYKHSLHSTIGDLEIDGLIGCDLDKRISNVHIGSLSTFFCMKLFESNDKFLKYLNNDDFNKWVFSYGPTYNHTLEYVRRFVWVDLLAKNSDTPFTENYITNLNLVKEKYNFDFNNNFVKMNLLHKKIFK